MQKNFKLKPISVCVPKTKTYVGLCSKRILTRDAAVASKPVASPHIHDYANGGEEEYGEKPREKKKC